MITRLRASVILVWRLRPELCNAQTRARLIRATSDYAGLPVATLPRSRLQERNWCSNLGRVPIKPSA